MQIKSTHGSKPLPSIPGLPQLLTKLQTTQETFFFKEALDLYIPPQMGRFVGDDKPQDASQVIRDWLHDPNKQCFLLLGDSGSGKTLFGQWLTRHTWGRDRFQTRLPLFIPLLAEKSPDKGLIDHYLKETSGIEKSVDRDWIKQQPLLLILDGFDEMHRKINLYRSNQLWQLKDVKIVISCRSQALANVQNYEALFYPCDSKGNSQPEQLLEYVVNPFNEKQIDAYIQHYVRQHQVELKIAHPAWTDWKTYQEHIQRLPGLSSLLTSPFVLSMVVQVLPTVVKQYEAKERTEQLHLAKINLYDHFVSQWFARQRIKLLDATLIPDNYPIEELFSQCSKSLAHAMLQSNVTSIELTTKAVSPLLAQQGFFEAVQTEPPPLPLPKNPQLKYVDEELFIYGEKIKLSFILAGCPVMKLQDDQYAFLHKSLLEYFAARKLFEGVMADASIAIGYELNEKLLIDEPATLQFLAARVRQDEKLKQRLFDVLEESKFDERVEIGAANAITILNYAGVSFSKKALKRIRIKGADLSHAILDSTDLRDADLREVTLKNAWLDHAKLGGALMEKVTFGELPYFKFDVPISFMVYSQDWHYLVVGSKYTLQLWELFENKPLKMIWNIDNSDSIKTVALSYDGKLLALNSSARTVQVWNVHQRKCVAEFEFKVRARLIQAVTFSPGNQLLTFCQREGTEDIEELLNMLGDKAVSIGEDDYIMRLWDVHQRKCIAKFNEDTVVYYAVFSFDGKLLASGSHNKVRLWNVHERTCLAEFHNENISPYSIAFSPDSKLLAIPTSNSTILLYDIRYRTCLTEFKGHGYCVFSVAFSPDGKLLASGSVDQTVRLWDIHQQTCLAEFKGHRSRVFSVTFSSDGKLLASGGYNDTNIRLWDVHRQKNLFNSTKNIEGLTFSSDGRLLAFGQDITVQLWDILKQQCIGELERYINSEGSLAFSLDGKLLASGSNDKVCLWDVCHRTYLAELQLERNEAPPSVYDYADDLLFLMDDLTFSLSKGVTSVAFSFDDKLLVSGDRDNIVRLWDVISLKCVGVLEGHTKSVKCVGFSPDATLIASGSEDATVRLWDVISRKCVGVLEGHTKSINSIVFSPNGEILASGSTDKMVRLWNVRSQKCVDVLEGHANLVNSVVFSPDGTLIASGSGDATVQLWDVKTRQTVVLSLISYIRSLAFNKVGENIYLAVASGGTIFYFEIKTIQSKPQLVLQWTIGHDFGLTNAQLDLGGVVGLDSQNENLLKQREAAGNLSTKETDKVLQGRKQLIPYDPKQPRYDLFSGQHLITPSHAIVSMVRKKNNHHVFLVVECIEANYYVITRADLFLDERQKHAKGLFLASGQALVEICVRPLEDMEELRGQCVHKGWKISSDRAFGLLANLEADRLKRIHYLNVGKHSFFNHKPQEETHSCLTWCETHLSQVGLDVSAQQSWFDAIIAHPNRHLPNREGLNGQFTSVSHDADPQDPLEPHTRQKCLIM